VCAGGGEASPGSMCVLANDGAKIFESLSQDKVSHRNVSQKQSDSDPPEFPYFAQFDTLQRITETSNASDPADSDTPDTSDTSDTPGTSDTPDAVRNV
jgi:hypothetical protein